MIRPVVVTRAQPGSQETAERLALLGYRPVCSPVLSLVSLAQPPGAFARAGHLVFTSANGVRVFQASGEKPDGRTAWCVGPATAAEARLCGFTDVIEGSGNAADLTRLMLSSATRLAGRILHIANEAEGGSLAAQLRAAGFDTEFCPAYAARPATNLTRDAQAALSAPGCVVLIHSARAAEVLASMQAPLTAALVLSISRQAARPLDAVPCAGHVIAAAPNEAALLEALQTAAPA